MNTRMRNGEINILLVAKMYLSFLFRRWRCEKYFPVSYLENEGEVYPASWRRKPYS